MGIMMQYWNLMEFERKKELMRSARRNRRELTDMKGYPQLISKEDWMWVIAK